MNNKECQRYLIFCIIILLLIFGTINIRANKINILIKPNQSIDEKRSIETINLKNQLSFAAFSDTHIGARYQYPQYRMADNLDKLGEDLVEKTNLLDFAINLGDIVNHNTAQVNGIGLPFYVSQYRNNLKAYHISKINIPLHCVIGNHDVNDYEMNQDDPHNLTKSLIDELSMNTPLYAMMRDGILFVVIPELGYIQWTHPIIYEWVEYLTGKYKDTSTIILCHQAIEDTTDATIHEPYRGKQDMEWWSNLFRNNPQIKMWIHGHNHFLSWYKSDKSSGITNPVQDFGHEIAFSAPYSQLDLGIYHNEDRVVIFNITYDKISTATWENNGFGGRWVDDYINQFEVSTTYDSNKKDWYLFSTFLQDNETQRTDMKVLSPYISLQLVGTKPIELFYDCKMESPKGKSKADEVILGFGEDRNGNVEWISPGMVVHGPTNLVFPEKTPIHRQKHEDGRSGPAYESFPMGTTCAAVPGQTYNFTIIGKSKSGDGRLQMSVSCSDWGTRSQYSTLSNSEEQIISHIFGNNYQTIHASYTVPRDDNAWFLQGKLHFLDSTDYEIKLFSIKRTRTNNNTINFHLNLSGNWYNCSQILYEDQEINFTIDPRKLADENGEIVYNALIDGNKNGMVNIIYHEPILLTRNARFKVNNVSENDFNLTIKNRTSRFSKIFKIIPFSTKSIYDYINIENEKGSNARLSSNNKNIWLTSDIIDDQRNFVEVILNGAAIEKPSLGRLYIFNNEIDPTIFGKTIIIGDINVQVEMYASENVDFVDFFLNDKKQFRDETYPFEWNWNNRSFSKHELGIKVVYKNGKELSDEIIVWKFL